MRHILRWLRAPIARTIMSAPIIATLLLIATPVLACQYGQTGGPVAGLNAINTTTQAITTATTLTPPTTYASGSNTPTTFFEAVVYVTNGTINYADNGTTPTASTTAGGAPYGASAAGGSVIDICGSRTIGLAKVVSQSGTANLVILWYGY